MKKIHIINPYGTLPNEGWRKYRTNAIAEYLASSGFDVVYWISNIDHRSKSKRKENNTEVFINQRLTIKVIESPNYNSNASWNRIFFEIGFAKKLVNLFIEQNHTADLIIVTDPALFYGIYLKKIIKKTKSKLLIDILDLWPEAFINILPQSLKSYSSIIFKPLFYLRKQIYNQADAFVAVTRDYLAVASKQLKKVPGKVFYIGIDLKNTTQKKEIIIEKKSDEKWIIYAGTLGVNYDVKTIMVLAEKIEMSNENIKLIIAGDGPLSNYVETLILNQKLLKTIFLGRVEAEQLNSIYSMCDIALSTYLKNSTVSLPVKAFDYMAFGIPVVNSLGREYKKLIIENKIGLQYEAENAESLFKQIKNLTNETSKLEEYKKNAFKLAKQFDAEEQYKNYVKFIEEILNNL